MSVLRCVFHRVCYSIVLIYLQAVVLAFDKKGFNISEGVAPRLVQVYSHCDSEGTL